MERVLGLAYEDREWKLFGRITWGLKRDRATAKRLLQRAMDQLEDDPKTAVAAFQIYADVVGAPAPQPERFEGLEQQHAKDWLMLVVFTGQDKTANRSRAAFAEAFENALPNDANSRFADGLLISDDQPTLVGYLVVDTVAARNAVRTLVEQSPHFRLANITWTTPAAAHRLRKQFQQNQ